MRTLHGLRSIAFLQIINNCLYDFSDEMEALSTLKVANELKAQSKTEKALRLFKHALALAPKHPEVLTSFGEFIEQNQSDIIKADLMYFQVSSVQLTLHQLALNNNEIPSDVRHLQRIHDTAEHLQIDSVQPKLLKRWTEIVWINWMKNVTHCRRYMNRMLPCDASKKKHIFNISIIQLASKAIR